MAMSDFPWCWSYSFNEEDAENTRKVENSLVSKLNCAYLVARKVSLPSVDAMLKREKQEADKVEFYKGFSVQLNQLINKYFAIEKEEDMEIEIAGNEQERNEMMPLLYVDSHRDKAALEVSSYLSIHYI